ncbi:MAG: alpha-2-macroglobulin family protein [Candidatus Electrothrix sp. YB6]
MKTKHSLLPFFLLCTVLLAFIFSGASPAAAEDHSLADLKRETRKFITGYRTATSANQANPEQAEILEQAGAIMVAADQCSGIMHLYKQAARYTLQPDGAFWLALARAAACEEEWEETSWSGWRAYQTGKDKETRKEALLLTGMALEKRTTVYANWTPAAIAVYEQLEELGGMADSGNRLAQLRRKQAEDRMLKVQKSFADTDSGHPELCIQFNDELRSPDAVHYNGYVRISPALKSDFSVEDRKLCIGGAAFSTTYNVTLRMGLKGKNKVLDEAASFTIETGRSPAALRFNRNDYILADQGSQAIGLYTVNVDKVHCRLFRIHERNILGDFVRRQFRHKLDQYDLNKIRRQVGEQVWEGTAEIPSVPDENVTSSVVLPEEALAASGLYVLVAEDGSSTPKRWEGQASQWLVKTDIGLTSYQGLDGLTVIARSLHTGLPLSSLKIILYARNNSPLARLTTDENGQVRFAPGLLLGKGGQAAVQLVAADKEHGFTFFQLEQAPFDLSDRGVAGRAAPGPIDAFVYTERGIYRPGESVNLVGLIRDQLGRATDAPPLTLRVNGPDAKVMFERLLRRGPSGAYMDRISLPGSARSGIWTAALYVDVEEKPVGQVSFKVKSFKPPRLEVRLEPDGVLTPEDNKAEVEVQADYLYGSPGAGLNVQARMRLLYDPHPFADFADFFFGRQGEEPGIATIDLPGTTTDDQGYSILAVGLEGQQTSTLQPLKAVVYADVLDIDGRAVSGATNLPVRHLPEYLGVKPEFTDQPVPADSRAAFSVISLNSKGQPRPEGTLQYRLVREDIDYQWFRKNGEWGYERIVRDNEELRDKLTWQQAGPLALALPVGRGNYRLELFREDDTLMTLFRFTAGEQLVGMSDTPDAVRVELDKQQYQVGETARLSITSPYPGRASLVLANSQIHGISNFPLVDDGQTVEIPVEADWGAGVYALVTVYQPGANRAVGLVWLNVDPAEQRLGVEIKTPEQIRPRQTLQVPVAMSGAAAGEDVRLTLAAVDEGVLQLTNFVSPDPLAWFFNKQQLGLEIRDLYGQLIIPPDSKPLVFRTGADEDSLRGAPESNVRIVSLFSGAVQVGKDGIATVPLEIPDFNGRLRLMAVAWSKEKLGSASRALRVNDPVVLSPSLPRYLAQGDQSGIQLLVENIDGPAGAYQITWKADGAVALQEKNQMTVQLEPGKRKNLHFPVQATGIGKGNLHLEVTGPEGYSYSGDFPLNTRGKYLPVLSREYRRVDPGEILTLDKQTISGLFPETAKVNLSISSAPNLDVAGLLAELDRYPYGCLEQLTSRAMPLLYANELAERFAYPADKELPGRVQEAIDLILQKQRGDGSFSLWSEYGEAEPWLSAYALDFLTRAREKGYAVSDYFYSKGMQWLTDQVKNSNSPEKGQLPALAHAHWVLARAGQGRHEDARYLFDTWFQQMTSPLAQAHIAGALALFGDRNRAVKGLQTALESAQTESVFSWQNYGSRLRDLAAVISIIADAKIVQADPAPAWQELTRLVGKDQYLSTQEQTWLIMAAMTLDKGSPLDLDIAGDPVGENVEEKPKKKPEKKKASLLDRFMAALHLGNGSSAAPADQGKRGRKKKTASSEKDTAFFALQREGTDLLTNPVDVKNKGTAAVWAVITVQGSPVNEPPPLENAFTVQRQWYSIGGDPLPADQATQGDMIVVTLEGEVERGKDFQALLVDLLPAGFEIEKTIEQGDNAFTWLDDLTATRYMDARDDRFVAAFATDQLPKVNRSSKLNRFRAAYLVRAVTPGTYTLPPVEVEAMYKPEYRARTGAGKVTVSRTE